MGYDSIDMVILRIDMGYFVTLLAWLASAPPVSSASTTTMQRLALVHFSAQLERFVWNWGARRGYVAHVKAVLGGV